MKLYVDKYQHIIDEAIKKAKENGDDSICLFDVFRSGPLTNRNDILYFGTFWKFYPGIKGSDDKGNWFLK